METASYTAVFLKDKPKGEYCIDSMAEEIEEQISDIEGFQELFDANEDGNLSFYFSFSCEIDIGDAPIGSHPYDCQRDCRLCDAEDNWQDAFEREREKAEAYLEKELGSATGFDRLEYND